MTFSIFCPCCGQQVEALDKGFSTTSVEVAACDTQRSAGVVSWTIRKSGGIPPPQARAGGVRMSELSRPSARPNQPKDVAQRLGLPRTKTGRQLWWALEGRTGPTIETKKQMVLDIETEAGKHPKLSEAIRDTLMDFVAVMDDAGMNVERDWYYLERVTERARALLEQTSDWD